jgi:1-acyl-sn-glycerol-3-phosphate acyltransferase
VALCRLLLRIFFRRIEVVGAHHVPSEGRVVFILNHPSGLVDPLFILCLSDRRVSFLAKEPLFRMPLVGLFVRAFDCLPVYRSRDGADPKKNREMMENAVRLLSRGNALALFPEGTSHSDPQLKPFKTGAARIALCAASPVREPVWLVPAALFYEKKDTFRSRAVLAFGSPLRTPRVPMDDTGQPARPETLELTRSLEGALEAIMPTAETADGLVLAEKAERILLAAERDENSPNGHIGLGVRMSTRRKLIDAYRELLATCPDRVSLVVDKVQKFSQKLDELGLPVDSPLREPSRVAHQTGRLILWGLLLAPLGLLGALLHYPTYRAIRLIAFRYAGAETDVLATVKLIGGLLLYPLTWALVSVGAFWATSAPVSLLAGLVGPPLAWVTLRFFEVIGALRRQERKKAALAASWSWEDLEEERSLLAKEILQLLEQAPRAPQAQGPSGASAPVPPGALGQQLR